MGIQKTDKIWHNGKLINWDDATLHVMSHVVHYGSSVFEGIRCYELPTGPAIFRAVEHMQRLVDSAKVYRMDLPLRATNWCAPWWRPSPTTARGHAISGRWCFGDTATPGSIR